MKGATAICSTCGTQFVKKTYHHTHCKTSCRVKFYRKQHGISEPDFVGMKRQSIAAKLHREEVRSKEKLFDLLQELEVLEQFRPEELQDLTQTILDNPLSMSFYQIGSDTPLLVRELGSQALKGKRLLVKDRQNADKLDTDTLPVWDILTESEQFDYVKRAARFCKTFYDYQDAKIENLVPEIAGEEMKKARKKFINYSNDIIAQIEDEIEEIPQEIARIQNASARRARVFGLQASTPEIATPSTIPENIIITTAGELEQEHTLPSLPLPMPFSELLGQIPFNPYIIIWGDAGSGKTGFTLRLLKALGRTNKSALCTSEASLTSADSPLVSLARLTKTKNVPLIQTHSIAEAEHIVMSKQFQFLAIDSASRLGLTPETVLKWRTASPNTMLILLMESTKGGTEFKGNNAWKHHCNIMIRAEVVKNEEGIRTNGRYYIEKNQYGKYAEIEL